MTPEALTALIDGTWPAISIHTTGPWTIRTGGGGGSRVSAATATSPARAEERDIEQAEAAMRELGQTPLFMIRGSEDALDAALAARGYAIKDPVNAYTCAIDRLTTQRPPPVTCFEAWPPLATQLDIWAEGGIDAARVAIMHRAPGPKTTILGRLDDTPAGTLFAAIHEGVVVLHAIETLQTHRRRGLARHMIRAAAFWGHDQGADTLALLVTRANTGANALYSSLGMRETAGYHYRIHPETR